MPKKIKPRGGPDPRSYAQFEREVVALLVVGHGIPKRAGRLVVKGNRTWVRKEWRKGSPPCKCSDRLAKRARVSRDADDPKEGDVFESRGGNRWRVTGTSEKGIEVERAGHRQSGKLRWSRGAVKGMKEVERKQLSLFGRDPDRRRRRRARRRQQASRVRRGW